MGIKAKDGRFYDGIVFLPEAPGLLCGPGVALGERTIGGDPDFPITKTIKSGGWGRWQYCKECYRNVLPYSMIEEHPRGVTNTCICSECGYGIAQTRTGL